MKNGKVPCDLNTCIMCRNCTGDWKQVIDLNRKMFVVKKGEQFFTEGEEMSGIYFVYSGLVKVHKQWGETKELILRFAVKGDIVGHRGLGKDNIYPVSGTALEDTIVCYIPLPMFFSTLKVNPGFLFEFMLFFAEELKVSERKMRNLAHMSVKGRVAQGLIYLKDKFGLNENGSINVSLSRQDLASYTGATYETVFRVLNELSEEGLIEASNREIIILNESRLNKTV